jgi:hypothetical protein
MKVVRVNNNPWKSFEKRVVIGKKICVIRWFIVSTSFHTLYMKVTRDESRI